MKTPREIVNKALADDLEPPIDYQTSEDAILYAMKEYAKQWVDRSVEIADMNIDATEIHSRISALSKEIDAQ